MRQKLKQHTLFLNENTPLQYKIMDQISPAIKNSIQLLKAEILSPDWTLSPRRNENLKTAMVHLHIFFNKRRYPKGLVAMVKQLLFHLDKDQGPNNNIIDILKEIMAHIVTIFEKDTPDLVFEKSICAHCLRQLKKIGISLEVKPAPPNKFAQANSSLQQDISQLQTLAPQFHTLSAMKQAEAMLTIQSLIAETRALKKIMAVAG